MNQMSENINTFWNLLEKHRIEIPIIQRDYAQGRNNPQSIEVRSNFVKQIKNILNNDTSDTSLNLNFIYGKIFGKSDAKKLEENKAAVKNMLSAVKTYSQNLDLNISWDFIESTDEENQISTSFIPLDGQQRLTTLFLLHLYLCPDVEHLAIFKRFNYKIRPSSKDFCEKLIENIADSINSANEQNTISKYIEDSSWFFNYWKKDPTVRGMLRMLDEIHCEFKLSDKELCWQRLNRIQFDFLDLDEYKLTDELYVKMNARGVPLTPFENFKAWLIEYIQKENIQIQHLNNKSWTELIDTSWTDLFWANKDEGNMLIDEELMRYFRNMMQILFVQQEVFRPEESKETSKEDAQIAREKAALLATEKDKTTGEYKYIPNSFYVDNKLLSDNNLNELFLSIDLLAKHNQLINEVLFDSKRPISFFDERGSIFRKFIDNDTTYPDKVVYYALFLFLKKIDGKLENDVKSSLRSWLRIIRNLITNSTIDSVPLFKRAINSITELSKESLNINDYLGKQNEKFTIQAIDGTQVKEEIKKASRIVEDNINDWESAYLKAENNKLLEARISFCLLDDEITIGEFSKRTEIINVAFNQKGCTYGYLLIRALLTKITLPLVNHGEEIKLINSPANWRSILNKQIIQEGISLLFAELSEDYEQNQVILEAIVEQFDNKTELWKYYIIKNGILLDSDSSRSKIIKRYYWDNQIYLYNNEGGNWINNNNQFLLSNCRNELIQTFVDEGIKLYTNEPWWRKKDGNTGQIFYRGSEIWLYRKINDNVSLWFLFSKEQVIFGLHNDEEKHINVIENDYDSIEGWIVAKKLSYPNIDFNTWKERVFEESNKIEHLLVK
jgi:hypothetical protein